MKPKLIPALAALGLALAAGPALAKGELHIYNWGDYTNPKLIEKFEKKYDVKVTQDDYDSNETMLAKVRTGNTGYDIVVPSDYTVKIMIDEGLLAKTEPDQMSNFKNMKPEYVDVYWDKGRHYSVPWQIGTTAFAVDTDKYKGDIDTYAILFDPPDALKGQINMLDDMNSIMHAAERYLGIPRCSADKANLKKVNDLLVKAKPNWKTFSYDTITKMTSGDVIVTQTWNGAAYRMRQKMPSVKYAYPKEGIEGWMDNVAVLKGAPNMENAKLFQNFIMEPENAALISEFAGYDNGIKGSEKFLPASFADAPEIKRPEGAPTPEFVPPCPPAVVKIYNQIWTNLRK
ncbi:extracellular solute-binding protein [Acidimangrovimonas sediminis]|uniref:extracellular solute-binding protein n=1 Tax=Acidimangrovimonas sediminis TaxID=2056283 RepID=UPI000C80969E|nr:extracellular solute-binding protein [Acidimangrovimonas sediminis]